MRGFYECTWTWSLPGDSTSEIIQEKCFQNVTRKVKSTRSCPLEPSLISRQLDRGIELSSGRNPNAANYFQSASTTSSGEEKENTK